MESVDNKSYADVSEEEKENRVQLDDGRASARARAGRRPWLAGGRLHRPSGRRFTLEAESLMAQAGWRLLSPGSPPARAWPVSLAPHPLHPLGPATATACDEPSLLARLRATYYYSCGVLRTVYLSSTATCLVYLCYLAWHATLRNHRRRPKADADADANVARSQSHAAVLHHH